MTAATKTASRPASTGAAYEDDFYTWTQEQGARLRAGDLAGIDVENLAEEIESLGRSQFDSLVGAWRVILLHMLEFDHQPERATRSWAISIATQRSQAADILEDNPGLKSRLQEVLERAYRQTRLGASGETDLPLKRFPPACPYTIDERLARPFSVDPDNPES